jgi:2,4-dienoyl-CoA reductase-like NADH-dependent reductase (Old Yellow Enzyme family)
MMIDLFEPTPLGGLTLRNRFVRSATWEGMATERGAVTPKLVETMRTLAKGGVGLIISGHAFVRPEGQAGPWQLGIYEDALVPGLREMTATAHAEGAKIVAQLAHAGRFAARQLSGKQPWVVSPDEVEAADGQQVIGPYEIKALIAAYAHAADRAKAAGFDGVQIHSAHGYLLSQFLSPKFNRRKDRYGGTLENRARLHCEIVAAIGDTVGTDFTILMKVNGADHDSQGLSAEEARAAVEIISAAGLDGVEVSGGLLTSVKRSPARLNINAAKKEAYHLNEAMLIKHTASIPVILVGGIRSLEVAQRAVDDGAADFIALSRPLIREPDLIGRWQSGDHRKAACNSDNLCFKPAQSGAGIYCVTAEREQAREERSL